MTIKTKTTPKWQPMETAPKDGTWILAYGDHETDMGLCGQEIYIMPVCYEKVWGWFNAGSCRSYNLICWTHLPVPPDLPLMRPD